MVDKLIYCFVSRGIIMRRGGAISTWNPDVFPDRDRLTSTNFPNRMFSCDVKPSADPTPNPRPLDSVEVGNPASASSSKVVSPPDVQRDVLCFFPLWNTFFFIPFRHLPFKNFSKYNRKIQQSSPPQKKENTTKILCMVGQGSSTWQPCPCPSWNSGFWFLDVEERYWTLTESGKVRCIKNPNMLIA